MQNSWQHPPLMSRFADWAGRVMFGDLPPSPRKASPIMASSSTLQSVTIAQALVSQNVSRDLAMSVPTIERARDVLVGIIGSLPVRYWSRRPVGVDDVEREPEQWMHRPDPNRTRTFMVGWTCDDLIFYGRAYWRVLTRFATGFPASFEWMPYTEVNLQTEHGRQFGPVQAITWRGKDVPLADVVVFDGLSSGLLSYGWRAISIALELDEAAKRFATAPVPMGWLQQTEGEPYNSEELVEIADVWHDRRLANVTAALSLGIEYREGSQNPERLQLMEARQHQALELARMMNVPPWVVGAPQGATMTYANATQARLDLIDFGALPHVSVVEETLSGPNVTPLGSYVKLDTDAWLRNPLLATPGASVEEVPPLGDVPKAPIPAPEEAAP